jgi:uncharacterized protein (DUF433 family)
MQLEDYFDFEKVETKFGPAERIRIKGHRISIEHVIEQHQAGLTPKQIVEENFPTLSLEEIYATITYYLRNKTTLDDYMRRGNAIDDAFYQEYRQQKPTPIARRVRALKNQDSDGSGTAHDETTPAV